ncbi:granulocyte-macrophage colony-stimulating factor receptor subunit alpha-like [Tiliqua scincoides]|uniref:granulocyte-macrophage colony-stimulating factor receptor subunit alpha-like n=1 Tax=Tiliqua scincoides TaxID=71010 RepID=UPI0034627180
MMWLLVLSCVSLVDLSHEESMKQTSVTNLSCVLYHVTAMNCTWNTGLNPPEEYFLYLNFNQKEEECPNSIPNEHGQHICHIDYVSPDKESVTATLKKLVNQSWVPFFTKDFKLYEIEILRPPQNITVSCNEKTSECIVKWSHPPNKRNVSSESCFVYEIKDEAGNTVKGITDTYKVYPADQKHTLQIRASGKYCTITNRKGEWSERIEFGYDPNTFPTIYLILVVFGTIVTILGLFILCKRLRIWQKLTDPIPQPNLILDPDENTGKAWVDLTQTADEKITLVEEMTSSCKKHGGLSSTSQLS